MDIPKIQVFILTYNRPQYVLRAVNSALNQNFDDYEVIISDNSTNDDTQKIIATLNNDKLKYKKREPSLPVIEHFNLVLSEVASDYFILFHDDDEMLPDYVSTLFETLKNNPDIVAAASNAFLISNGEKKEKDLGL